MLRLGFSTAFALVAATFTLQAQPPRAAAPEKLDAAAEKWLLDHLKSIADENLTIRSSAREAVVSIGSSALPALRTIAEGKDTKLAEAARAVIDRINDVDPARPLPGNPAGNRPMGGPGRLIEDAIAGLELTDEQKPKVRSIVADFHGKLMAANDRAREGGERPDPMVMREAMKKINEELIQEMKEVLNKNQMESLQKAMQRGPGPMRQPGERPPEKN